MTTSRSVVAALNRVWHVVLLSYGRHGGPLGTPLAIGAMGVCGVLPFSYVIDVIGLDYRLQNAVLVLRWAMGIVLVGLWCTFVGDVIDQNRPADSRLVPAQVSSLRQALIGVWAIFVALVAMTIGRVSHEPLLCAMAAALAMAALAAAMRWTLGNLVLVPTGIALLLTVGSPNWGALGDVLKSAWRSWPVACFGVSSAAAALLLLLALVGRRSVAEARGGLLLRRSVRRETALAPGLGTSASVARHGVLTWPFAWWARHLLSRRDSAPMSRMMLAFGPGMHWTTQSALTMAMGIAGMAILWALSGSRYAALAPMVPVLLGALMLLLQCAQPTLVASSLGATSREQALMKLLPGVAQGSEMNRPLAVHLTSTFIALLISRILAMELLLVLALRIDPRKSESGLGAALPLAALSCLVATPMLWRRWASMSPLRVGESLADMLGVAMAPGAVLLAFMLVDGRLSTVPQVALAYGAVVVGCGVIRWRRMAREPAAFPVGRLAKC